MDNEHFRKATAEDIMLIFNWSNDSEVRKNSFTKESIELAEHQEWFERKINDKNCIFLIYNDGTNNAGQLRLEFEDDIALITYDIAKEFRGLGHGKKMLKLAEKEVPNGTILQGFVKKSNVVSVKIFKSLGYEIKSDLENYEFQKYINIEQSL